MVHSHCGWRAGGWEGRIVGAIYVAGPLKVGGYKGWRAEGWRI
jgi:hypothetical protein